MKRRLMNVYDAMTMPESCSDRIELRLRQEVQAREAGVNVKLVDPVSRKKPWAAAIAAVCAVLALSVGGTVLFLSGGGQMKAAPAETAVTKKTPEDHYAPATQLSVEEVEAFAKVVRSNILTENWEALSKKVRYPISMEGREIKNEKEFVALMEEITLGVHVWEAMEQETCTAMPCTVEGIWMGNGLIRIQEGKLRSLEIVGFTWLTVNVSDYTIMREPDGTEYYHEYSGREKTVRFPEPYGVIDATTVGTGMPVILYGDIVETVVIGESITAIGDYAFANCPALTMVHFQGDAPPEAEGVFEGSENVVVYYPAGAKGWGKTWCGRETRSTVRINLTLDAADALERQKMANTAFREVLGGGVFLDLRDRQESTLDGYCEKMEALYGKEASVSAFTVVDMDRDGVKEVVCRVTMKRYIGEKYLILRWENGTVRGYSPEMKISDLKKDGSFYWTHDAQNQGETVMEFQDDCMYMSWAPQTEQDRVPVLWHTYPCNRADLVLGSYGVVSGVGESLLPGTLYWEFALLADGSAANDWRMWKELLLRWGMVWEETDGGVTVYDPDAPGVALYGSLTEDESQFTGLGLYICTEEQEYQAEIREMNTDRPEYWVDVSSEAPRQAGSGAELMAFFDPVADGE